MRAESFSIYLRSSSSICSSDVDRQKSGWCRYLSSILTHFLRFNLSRFSFYINIIREKSILQKKMSSCKKSCETNLHCSALYSHASSITPVWFAVKENTNIVILSYFHRSVTSNLGNLLTFQVSKLPKLEVTDL